ncbi:hypothetical protein [Salinispora arenicola]|uniref:hypothetical protein n=1 Tax=Salinispora arenicola TaxID=168697 RepID=UPI002079E9DF|nr:hypothetical protein [Salinispora arenicola]MCN0154997.1 hypothetical protein [Salinispora arenicola]
MIVCQLPQPRLGLYTENSRDYTGSRPPHTPLRPKWLCRACGQQWPRPEARLLPKVEYSGRLPSLTIYLAGLMYEAMHDLYHLNPNGRPSPRELFDRFVSWA